MSDEPLVWLLVAVCGYGYLHNIYLLATSATATGMSILRAVGMFFAPLGVLLGYF